MPSVRGRQKTRVGALYVASGTASAALAGFVVSLLLSPLPSLSSGVVAGMVVAGITLDLINMTTGRPKPPAVGRQVPREWGRLFDPEVVAVLYGARLGIGPLTILSTWTWWAFTIAAGLIGPAEATVAGLTFGLVRQVVTVTTSVMATRSMDSSAHSSLFGSLRRRQRPNWVALNGAGFLLAVVVLATGCVSSRGTDSARDSTITTSPAVTTPITPTTSTTATPSSTAASNTAAPSGAADGRSSTIPVRLEDVVRTTTTAINTTDPTGSTLRGADSSASTGGVAIADPEQAALGSTPDELATALPNILAGFTPIDEPDADRFLDLDAASAIQPDPTEEVALLETRGFAGGWTRAFRSETNDVAVASVYHFRDDTEAEFYLEDGLITIGGYGGTFFDIPAMPRVRGFVQYFDGDRLANGETEELVSLGAAFQLGPRWYLLYLVGSVETTTPAVLIPAVTALSESADRF